jgi:hypothetical protein
MTTKARSFAGSGLVCLFERAIKPSVGVSPLINKAKVRFLRLVGLNLKGAFMTRWTSPEQASRPNPPGGGDGCLVALAMIGSGLLTFCGSGAVVLVALL